MELQKVADKTQKIFDLISAYPLTQSGEYVLVDNNAILLIDGIKAIIQE